MPDPGAPAFRAQPPRTLAAAQSASGTAAAAQSAAAAAHATPPPATRSAAPPTIGQPVIRSVRFFLAHTPGLVPHGSKPARDALADPALRERIAAALRPYAAARD